MKDLCPIGYISFVVSNWLKTFETIEHVRSSFSCELRQENRSENPTDCAPTAQPVPLPRKLLIAILRCTGVVSGSLYKFLYPSTLQDNVSLSSLGVYEIPDQIFWIACAFHDPEDVEIVKDAVRGRVRQFGGLFNLA